MMKATIFFIVYFILVASYAGATRNCKGLNHDDLEVKDIVAAKVLKILDCGSTGGIGPQTYEDNKLTYEFVVEAGKSPFGHLKIHEWYKPDDEEYNEKKDLIEKKKSECGTSSDLQVNDIVGAKLSEMMNDENEVDTKYRFVKEYGVSPFGSTPYFVRITPNEKATYKLYKEFVDETDPE